MAAGKIIGKIEASTGDVKIVGIDGSLREPIYGGYMYENEQIVSNDPNALFQIKFLALPESNAYDGVFKILTDGSVIYGRDVSESVASQESLSDILSAKNESVQDINTMTGEDDLENLETAAGEESVQGNTAFTETDIVAKSSVLEFNRGTNSPLGFGIVEFGSQNNDYNGSVPPPAFNSPNATVYDENGTDPVIQINATGNSAVTYSISGLDSHLFNINQSTGIVSFNESPDFENPKDLGGDNEYNMYVTATDAQGNYTTQLLSVSVNNVNEAVFANDDSVNAVEDTVLNSTIDLDANDYDLDGTQVNVVAGTFTTAQGGTIVIAANGSYTYTPPANFNGTDSVNYTVTDGEFSDTAKLTINVASVEDATVVNNDNATTSEDTPVTINVLANDTDIDSAVSPVVSATNGTYGTTVVNSDGTITYTPNANYNGPDSFTYTNAEGTLGTVSVTVNPVNDAPTITVTSINNFTEDAPANTVGSVVATYTTNDADGDSVNVILSDTTNYALNGSGSVTLTAAGLALVNSGVDLPAFTLTPNDGIINGTAANVDPTVTPVDDITTLSITTYSATEDTTKAGDVIATYSVSDADEAPNVGFTSGTNSAGYYDISGNNIILTAEGEAHIDGGGTLPVISLTTSGTSTDITVTATPTTIAAADALINVTSSVGDPLFNLADFTLSDDTNSNPAIYESNGLIITSVSGLPLSFNPGNGLGVDSGHKGDEPKNIDGLYNEALDIKLPSSVFALNLDVKHTANDLIGIELYNGTQKITSGIIFKDSNGNTLTLTSSGYINGNDLNSGNALDTIKVISNTIFDKIIIKDADISSNQDGFTLVNIYDPQSINGYYTYDFNMSFDLKEVDENVQRITLSGFDPLATDTKLVFSGSITAEISDVNGVITIDNPALLSAINSGTVNIVLASTNQIADNFEPVFDALTIDSPSIIAAHTILGGAGDDITLSGGAGNDYIDGRTGNDTISGNDGNDTLLGNDGNDYIDGGVGDDIIYGGIGNDTILGNSGNDYIDGGLGADTIHGGEGNDTIVYDSADIEIDGGAGLDTIIATSGVVNLSNISNINTIQLGAGASVTGSGTAGAINANDVINASDDDGVLVIQSADGDAVNQVNIDTTTLTQVDSVTVDGIDYIVYSNGHSATLLVQTEEISPHP